MEIQYCVTRWYKLQNSKEYPLAFEGGTVPFFFKTGYVIRSQRYLKVDWKKYIVSSPDVLKGKPRIKDTRISVSLVLGYLAEGKSTQDIVTEFPDLKPEHIKACLDYAKDLAEYQVATG